MSSVCAHRTIVNCTCAECNQKFDPKDVFYIDPMYPNFGVTKEVAQKVNSDLDKWLMSNKKLNLVIDLDKTLIDTAVMEKERADTFISNSGDVVDEFLHFTLNEPFLVKIRPHIKEFLEAISPHFRMQVYTLAKTEYATKILEYIDPESKYFHNRIYSRVHPTDPVFRKSIHHLFPYSTRFVLVLDDTEDVWRNEDGRLFSGLIQIEPYMYFPTQHSPKLDEQNSEATLLAMKDILLKIHSEFYQDFDPESSHVLTVVDDVKRCVFDECHFLFMGCWKDNAAAEMHKIVKKAEQFGACVYFAFAPFITHIIVGPTFNEELLLQAKEYSGIHIVNVLWFFKSCFSISRLDENLFPMADFPTTTNGKLSMTEPPDGKSISDIDLDPSDSSSMLDDPDWLKLIDQIPDSSSDEE